MSQEEPQTLADAIAALGLPPQPTTREEVHDALSNLTIPGRDVFNEFSLFQMRMLAHFLRFLAACVETACSEGHNFRLHGECLCFNNSKARETSFESWERAIADEELPVLKEVDMKKEKDAWGLVTNARFNFRALSVSLYLLNQSDHPAWGQSWLVKAHASLSKDDEARASHAGRSGETHCFAVLIREKTMYIYDPSWDPVDLPEGSRLNEARMVSRARALRDLINKGKKKAGIRDIFIGGGGNVSNECLPWSLQWVVDWVRHVTEAGGAQEPDMAGFVRLKP